MTKQQSKIKAPLKSLHILGICGTFMGGVAKLAQELGYRVTGQDANVYPPMSTQLEKAGVQLISGYEAVSQAFEAESVVIGNALSRGKFPVLEEILNQKLSYYSGPAWVSEHILKNYKTVIAVSGTHGKTTTTSMISWILEFAGYSPGFLIGGVPENFGLSARLGKGDVFVIEADEYDSAFFDKRSKFIHYHPDILVLNNLEFDHADIFPDLNAIQKQFEYLIRTVPSNGLLIKNQADKNLSCVLDKACWTPVETFGKGFELSDWQIGSSSAPGDTFEVIYKNKIRGSIQWSLIGEHNQLNALAAISAAHRAGVDIPTALSALSEFKSVKRRLEYLGNMALLEIYSDFAHHPTAIQTTLSGLRAKVGQAKIIAVLECGSNTMKLGVHKKTLPKALALADFVIFLRPKEDWGIDEVKKACQGESTVCNTVEEILEILNTLSQEAREVSNVVLMSNGGFGRLPEKLLGAKSA